MRHLGEKDNRSHDVIIHETPDPRTFGVECSCGWRVIAFFGRESAEVAIDKHYSRVGVTQKVYLL